MGTAIEGQHLFDANCGNSYTSASQKARVLSELWTHQNMFCPSCGAKELHKLANNRPVADFSCPSCNEVYELKSKRGLFGRKLTDGAYGTMISRLAEDDSPSLFLLSYGGAPLGVTSFSVVPKQFIVPSLIEPRRPLAPTARRAGWVGCNILLSGVPQLGRITMFEAGNFRSRLEVNATWRRTLFLRREKQASWLIHVMKGIETLGLGAFTLADAYRLEGWLRSIYPNNRHVRPKIRQQLQRLRDSGYLEFSGRGIYRVVNGRETGGGAA